MTGVDAICIFTSFLTFPTNKLVISALFSYSYFSELYQSFLSRAPYVFSTLKVGFWPYHQIYVLANISEYNLTHFLNLIVVQLDLCVQPWCCTAWPICCRIYEQIGQITCVCNLDVVQFDLIVHKFNNK